MTEPLHVLRLERARHLGQELRELTGALATTFTGGQAALFIDRWVRCAAYAEEEQTAAGLTALVADGRRALEAERELLSKAAASGLDLESVSTRTGLAIDGDEGVEVEDLALDLLLVAAVMEHLPPEARGRAQRTLEEAMAAMLGLPDRFEAVTSIAVDRARLESVARQPAPVRTLIRAMADVARDADELAITESLGRKTRHEVIASAIEESLRRQQEPLRPVSQSPRQNPDPTEGFWAFVVSSSSRPMLAAADHDLEEVALPHISPLLFLVKAEGKVTLEWVFEAGIPAPDLWRTRPRSERLVPALTEGGQSWSLTPELKGAGLELRWEHGRIEPLDS